ncbi:unnamed protein product [Acanthoscelides obtectus]|uniref:Serine/threonine-protein kinase ATM n=1 Tax=Acanthoscelides obtectus TaxID=200917 RepID=A0A9P0LUR4_ACAOB|nr:unnamed protein product [Acanthoscelides obtectus]CAK1663215.1 Serine-protein kinase ATM [Acanthoscelides obtectus]
MEYKKNIDLCCSNLASSKVADRKKYSEKLSTILDDHDVIETLNDGIFKWENLVYAVQEYLKKEAEKNAEDIKKKGTSVIPPRPDIFLKVIKLAVAQGNINISHLVGYFIGCLKDNRMKRCYEDTFLHLTENCILNKAECREKLKQYDWIELYKCLKLLHREKSNNSLVDNCLTLTIKWGPSNGFPFKVLREEFDFITEFCQRCNTNLQRRIKENIVTVAVEFTKANAKDSRMACCKFGENIVEHFIDIYDTAENVLKVLLIEFFLLQTVIHHPDGAYENEPRSYAHNWTSWNKYLRWIYTLLNKEIHKCFKSHSFSGCFFIVKGQYNTLAKDFLILFVDVSRQVFRKPDIDVSMTIDCSTAEQGPQKRQKLDLGLKSYINKVELTKSWLWIRITSQILQKYPDLIDIGDYKTFLRILYTVQIESNEPNVLNNVYSCFSTMLNIIDDVSKDALESQEIAALWNDIGVATMRAFTLNQERDVTEKLLEALILRKIISFDSIQETYTSGIFSLTSQSISTINTGLQSVVLYLSKETQTKMIKCILNVNNFKNCNFLLKRETASVLINLTQRQWLSVKTQKEQSVSDAYAEIKQIYYMNAFEKVLIETNNELEYMDLKSTNIDTDIYFILIDTLKSLVNNIPDNIEVQLSMCVLILNILNCLFVYGMRMLDHEALHTMFKNVFNSVNKNHFDIEGKQEAERRKILGYIRILDESYSHEFHQSLVKLVRQTVPQEVLKLLVKSLNILQDDKNRSDLSFQLKQAIIKNLSKFACIGDTPTERQLHVLEVLALPNYDCTIADDYFLLLTFLKTFKQATPGALPSIVFSNILKLLQEVCVARYEYSEDAANVLSVLHDLYPHLALSDDEDDKHTGVALLKPFYENMENYNPKVLVTLLNCLKQLFKVDPQFTFSLWSGVEVINFVPAFLCNDCQVVRFAAIETLVTFFKIRCETGQLRSFHRQEETFIMVYEMSLKVVGMACSSSEEHKEDEMISRRASVLQTFANIIIYCPEWIEECIYAMLKISVMKKLGSLSQIFCIINQNLKLPQDTNLMEKYLENILEKWASEDLDMNQFQFHLFGCETKSHFYKKYFDICVPLFITSDRKDLIEVARQLKLSENDIVQRTSAKVFVRSFTADVDNLSVEVFQKNKVLAYYAHVVGHENLLRCLTEGLDEIMSLLMNLLTDNEYILESFGASVIFPLKKLTLIQMKQCINFIEILLCDNQNIVKFFKKKLHKLQKVLFVLKSNIYESLTTSEKIKSLHRYVVFIRLVIENIEEEAPWVHYFIRDTVYGLINMISNSNKDAQFGLVCCKAFEVFLKDIIPSRFEMFDEYLVFTINSLKALVVQQPTLKSICLDLLDFLIVKNSQIIHRGIGKLEFPQHPDYDKIVRVYRSLNGNTEPTLEEEINNYLKQDYSSTREDSLVHLKSVLSSKKTDLKKLYETVQRSRGFSDDCERSLIHRLVCSLAKLCCSPCERESFEAARCLGELGPADLGTLILKPEKNFSHPTLISLELLVAQVLLVLTEYIVDPDILVVKAASDALYEILISKESRKIIDASIDLGTGTINKKYILPYFRTQPSTTKLTIDLSLFKSKVGSDSLWCPSNDVPHNVWITKLLTTILETVSDGCFLQKLVDVAKLKPKFCEKALPYLTNFILSLKERDLSDILSQKINYFFSCHWDRTVTNDSNIDSVITNKKSVKCMLDVVEVNRLPDNTKSRITPLNINFLKAANAAEFCSAHFTALLYSDLWCQTKIDEILDRNNPLAEQRSTMLDTIYENESEEIGEALQNILRNAYKAVGDLDALSGCGTYFLLKPQTRVEHYRQFENWERVVQFYAIKSPMDRDDLRNLMESFKSCRLYQIPLLCSKEYEKEMEQTQYECLWRLSEWDTCDKNPSDVISSVRFEESRYFALKSLHGNNYTLFDQFEKLQLQSVVDAEDYAECSKVKDFGKLLTKWQLQFDILKNNYHYLEPVVAQRATLLKDYLRTNESPVLEQYLTEMLFDLSNLCKDEKQFKDGWKVLEDLKKIVKQNDKTKNAMIQLLDAQLSWMTGDGTLAKHILNKLSKNEDIGPRLRALALKQLGEYLSDTNSENTLTIINDYYRKSISLMTSAAERDEDRCNIDTYEKCATFMDQQYQQVNNYMKTELFQRKVLHMQSSKKTASEIEKQRKKTRDEARAAAIHNRQSNIDEVEIRNLKQERCQYLKMAMEFYLKSLKNGDNKMLIFRAVSLLLENRSNQDIVDLTKKYLEIPSYKYITMLPQLIPHITDDSGDNFNHVVNAIVLKCAEEHQHHTIPIILSLLNAHKDKEYSSGQTKTISNDGRVAAAKNLITKLNKNKTTARYIEKLQNVCLALIELAYYIPPMASDKKKEYAIPKGLKIMKIKNFNDIPLPICSLEVNPSKNYDRMIGIASFADVFYPVGGINAPKRTFCIGTDGKKRSMLVKGHDDLRQDAVMQQVFTIMNNLLSSGKQTKNLLIRTYKIVPLSMRSGVLEWVDNSMTIGSYLVGDAENKDVGAHVTYRPRDRKPKYCRDALAACAGKSPEQKLATYKKICHEFKPVFHKFFESTFPHPSIWYERRRAYVRSVATASMCGYVLGIGDRHVQNILIDKTTAEVIHIDFGIAFEQGKILPTPETVPFRLTRDIVDGMGVSGVEGDFRRSCEKTMEVLRQHYQTIISILEVLLYDPLYAWTVTSAEANKRQTDESNSSRNSSPNSTEEENHINITADRALLRIREKLQGTELGHPTTIEHQVGTLIQQATDPANLCKLFVGWQPYL